LSLPRAVAGSPTAVKRKLLVGIRTQTEEQFKMLKRDRLSVRRVPLLAITMLVVLSIASSCSSSDNKAEEGGGGGSDGPITAVRGSACSFFVNVGLFGGPQQLRGCGEVPPGPTPASPGNSYAPNVALPENGSGSATPITASDPDGAKAQYGPAVIHGGLWPCEDVGKDENGDGITGNCPSSAPASGPQAASTQGTPADGTVKSSADITLNATPVKVSCYPAWGPNPPSTEGCVSYGGSGPFPVQADSLHVECTATADSVTGATTFKNAQLATKTDVEGNPIDQEAVPDSPPANYTKSGVITNVGDVFTVVYNEQIVNSDGSLTVNGVHMYLFGPVAVGEVVRGQATCGTTPSKLAAKDKVAPTCGFPVVEPMGPEDPKPKAPRTVLIGVFDAGGIKSITNVKVTNGFERIGKPDTGQAYLEFKPGQTGPLPVTFVRFDDAETKDLPLSGSFDVTDMAGNLTHCSS
jgi:hypothetical protein